MHKYTSLRIQLTLFTDQLKALWKGSREQLKPGAIPDSKNTRLKAQLF